MQTCIDTAEWCLCSQRPQSGCLATTPPLSLPSSFSSSSSSSFPSVCRAFERQCTLKASFHSPQGFAILIRGGQWSSWRSLCIHPDVCVCVTRRQSWRRKKRELQRRERKIQPALQLFTVLNIYGFATNIIEDFNTPAVFHTMMSYPRLSRSHTQPRLKRGSCISWQSHYLPQSLLLLTSLVAYLEKYAYLLHLPLQLHNYTR